MRRDELHDGVNGVCALCLGPLQWRKGSRSSAQGNCVETARLPGGGAAVRNSRHPAGPALVFTDAEIRAFLDSVKQGDFDDLLGDANPHDDGTPLPHAPRRDDVTNPGQPPADAGAPAGASTDRPSPARIYNYLLGGKDNFPADRAVAEKVLAITPELRAMAQSNRTFLRTAVTYVAEAGVDQFVDLGAGIPAPGNTHEVARAVHPGARVVYVDNDPVVLAHGRALLAGDGVTVIDGDVRDTAAILADPALRAVVDLDRPVGVLLLALLHFIDDDDVVAGIMATLRDALAPGSYVLLTHLASDRRTDVTERAVSAYRPASATLAGRTQAQVTRLFDGFELVPPGVFRGTWHPGGDPDDAPDEFWGYGAVARKP